jgi:hypothetical protein
LIPTQQQLDTGVLKVEAEELFIVDRVSEREVFIGMKATTKQLAEIF